MKKYIVSILALAAFAINANAVGYTVSLVDEYGDTFSQAYIEIQEISVSHWSSEGHVVVYAWKTKTAFDSQYSPFITRRYEAPAVLVGQLHAAMITNANDVGENAFDKLYALIWPHVLAKIEVCSRELFVDVDEDGFDDNSGLNYGDHTANDRNFFHGAALWFPPLN